MGCCCKVNKDKGILEDSLEIGSLEGDCCLHTVVDKVVTSSLEASD